MWNVFRISFTLGGTLALDSYSPREIDYWARRICEISKKADVFGYWNNDAHGNAPQNCLELTRKLPSL
ncbi:MAG: DUF72 domain-containing protein [Halobacteriota archaeon]|jgi:uncharacterized protein YecE (DUF72 family)